MSALPATYRRDRRHGAARTIILGGERRCSANGSAFLLPSTEAEEKEAAARRIECIRELAYRNAADRGFEPGHELDDWLAAEREVLLWEAGQRFSGD
jgi:hypothetical protein